MTALPHPNRGQAVDDSLPGGVVYFPSESDLIYARAVEDGSEVWTQASADGIVTPPALDNNGRLFVGGTVGDIVRAHAISDGQVEWTGPGGGNQGVIAVDGGNVYAARSGFGEGFLWCLEASTGRLVWAFESVGFSSAGVALSPNGIVYVDSNGDNAELVAVSADGEEMWRYEFGEQVKHPPIVAGDGTIYACSFYNPNSGHVHAIDPNGSPLWTEEMPDYVQASPMLAPDGTLYVICRDKKLYAFKDPAKGDVSLNDIIDGRDIRFFIRVLFGVDDDEFRYFAADMNSDGVVDVNDVPPFVDTLLTVEN